jgi:hypothetical protein
MNRTYTNGESSTAKYFTGPEVEHTVNYGKKTLFIVGKPEAYHLIEQVLRENDCHHYFFGANNSFHPQSAEEVNEYAVCMRMLSMSKPVSIDVGIEYMPLVMNSLIPFVPGICIQIKVPIPKVENLNANTYLKIDDIGFNITNPGVWTVPLSNITSTPDSYNDWTVYKEDTML